MRKNLLVALPIFLAAVLIGFLGERRSLQSSSVGTRQEMAAEAARVLRTLRPLLRADPLPGPALPAFPDFTASDPAVGLLFELGIMKGFPDGTFRPQARITRGEGLALWAALQKTLSQRMFRPPFVLARTPVFTDVGPDHWLAGSLAGLAGIGALACFPQQRLAPDLPLTSKEITSIGRAFIEYFGGNLFVMEVRGDGVKLHPKGALDALSLEGWTCSWNDSDWMPVPEDGFLAYPGRYFRGLQLSLRHPEFDSLGPVEIVMDPSVLWFLQVRKDMARFRERMRRGLTRAPDGAERFRLESHLAALRSRLRKRDGDRGVVLGEMPVAGRNSRPSQPPEELAGKMSELPPGRDGWPGETPVSSTARGSVAGPDPEPAVTPDDQRPGFMPPAGDPDPDADADADSESDVDPDLSELAQAPAMEDEAPAPTTVLARRSGRLPPSRNAPAVSRAGQVQVTGRVLDARTRLGVGGATILMGDRDFTTGPDGRFSVALAAGQPAVLTVYGEGYEPLFWRGRPPSAEGELRLALSPLHSTMEGRIVDFETGDPVPQAVVQVSNRQVRTGPDGRFAVPRLLPTYHQVTCRAPGYMDAVEVIYVSGRQDRKEIRLRSLAPAQVSANHRPKGLDFGN